MTTTCAAIDLGSNLIRLAIGERQPTGCPRVTHKSVEVVRIAAGLHGSGEIQQAALDRACVALERLCARAKEHQVVVEKSVATGALRLAANRQAALARLRSATGLDLEVISGEREAQLSALGVASQAGTGRWSMIDIGGTTTEIVTRGAAPVGRSFDIGVITLTEQAARVPPSQRALHMRRRADQTFAALVLPEPLPQPLFAAGGAAVALMAWRDRDSFLEFIGDGRTSLSGAERAAIQGECLAADDTHRGRRLGISPDHAALVPAGIAILDALLARLCVDAVIPTGRGVVEGLLCEMLAGSPA